MNSLLRFAFLALVCISSLASVDLAQAKGQTEVSKDAVLAACRHTSGCSYGTDTNTGETAGCSPHACFYCKGSTCHQTPLTRGTPGLKPEQFDATVAVKSDSQSLQGTTKGAQHQGAFSMASKSVVTSTARLQQSIN